LASSMDNFHTSKSRNDLDFDFVVCILTENRKPKTENRL
jgi:hypothetical protein